VVTCRRRSQAAGSSSPTAPSRSTKQKLSFVAFHADCRHEIKPVRSGYRIVLTYKLSLGGDDADAIVLLPALSTR